ncbi:MAG: 3-hydroxyacyl-CoA dehydrogenase / enoyl-CoA hydratase / 3-hydroxybutyryl-CoA epimerase [Azoarcus sp.]|nr:3-hydroxyacyl-CoA dehydrogenase / enoyl-CoA hydratase / 3-hydroxybutyryl-CoA epimerase [Azoarcus sp.]
MNTLKLEVDADGIALVTIDLPGRPMNVLATELIADLGLMLDEVVARVDVRGVVISSAKSNGFIAGGDLKELVEAHDRGWTPQRGVECVWELSSLFRRLETCGKPIAAAMNGLALGGGLELALACHYRVLADDPKAVVGLPEVTIGLLPGAGGTQRLSRLIGIEKALPLILGGDHVKPAVAAKLGIVHALAPLADVVATARRWLLESPDPVQPWDKKGFRVPGGAGCLAPQASQSFMLGTAGVRGRHLDNYPAPKAILSAVFEGTQLPIDRGLAVEAKYFGRLLVDPVARNIMRTTFINRTAANKLVRRPASVPKSAVRRLGILGAGTMGGGIAYCAASAGIDVVLLDATQENADRGKDYSRRILAKDLERGRTTADKMDALLARIHPVTRYEALDGCDLVIEAVFEDRTIKAGVTAKAEAVIAPDAIFASNTSTLMIGTLAEKSSRPANFIGMHFFSPVDKMPLVEVIVGRQTSDTALARALDLVGQLRKTPIVVNDGPAFYTTRVFCTYVDEGLQMLADGVEPALIENAARNAGMPIGPLAVLDETTQELRWKVILQAQADGLPAQFTHPAGREVLRALVEDHKRLGRRQGGGLYDYPAGAKKHLWPGIAAAFPATADQPDVEDLKKRLLYVQALEAARCYEQGIVTEAADADLGSVLGVGYPTWTGGTLSFIDTVGIRPFVDECRRLAARWGARFEPSPWLVARAERGERFYPLPA